MKKISKLKFELFPRTTLVGRENLVVVRLEEAEAAFGVFGRGRFVLYVRACCVFHAEKRTSTSDAAVAHAQRAAESKIKRFCMF